MCIRDSRESGAGQPHRLPHAGTRPERRCPIHRVPLQHYPPEKIAFFMRTPTWCRSRADGLGEHVAELIAGLLADTALHHLRAAQGILGLADKYGPDRLDAACARSLAVGDPSYRTVKGILAVGADPQAPPPADRASGVTPAHLHGPDGLFAHLDGAGDAAVGASGQASLQL